MTERQHVPTTPGEPVAPEIVEQPIRLEPGGHVQGDDINVTLVAIVGILAVVLLFVIIAGLQTWFYNWSAQEIAAKTKPDPALAGLIQSQLSDLQGGKENTMPIGQAMELTIQQYAAARP